MRLLALWALAWALFAAPGEAHTASRSFSVWHVEANTLVGVVSTDARRVTQLISPQGDGALDFAALLARHARMSITAQQAGAPCSPAQVTPRRSLGPGDVRVEVQIVCPRPIQDAGALLSIRVFRDASPSHVHYLRADLSSDAQIETVLTATRDHVELSLVSPVSSFLGFVQTGASHVLGGLDHIAFLLALALLAGRALPAALAATGFTIGHSVTLALVALGLVRPNEPAIEALIGFTVAYAAAEALAERAGMDRRLSILGAGLIALTPLASRALGGTPPDPLVYLGVGLFVLGAGALRAGEPQRFAPALAGVFGLAHGAGFAGALGELDLPSDRLVGALFGFNLGVELGQLIALAGFGAAAWAARTLSASWRSALKLATLYGLFALGVFWFAERSL